MLALAQPPPPSLSTAGHLCHTGMFQLACPTKEWASMLMSSAFVDLAKPFPQLVALPACFWQCINRHSVQSQVPQEAGTPPPTDLLVESPKGAQGPRVGHKSCSRGRGPGNREELGWHLHHTSPRTSPAAIPPLGPPSSPGAPVSICWAAPSCCVVTFQGC